MPFALVPGALVPGAVVPVADVPDVVVPVPGVRAAFVHADADALRCPPRLPGPHPGFARVGPVPAAHWLLWRMRLFDAGDGRAAPKELAPGQMTRQGNGFTLTWHLSGVEDLLMVCRYDGSETYYRARADPPPATCTMRNDNGLTQAWCGAPLSDPSRRSEAGQFTSAKNNQRGAPRAGQAAPSRSMAARERSKGAIQGGDRGAR